MDRRIESPVHNEGKGKSSVRRSNRSQSVTQWKVNESVRNRNKRMESAFRIETSW